MLKIECSMGLSSFVLAAAQRTFRSLTKFWGDPEIRQLVRGQALWESTGWKWMHSIRVPTLPLTTLSRSTRLLVMVLMSCLLTQTSLCFLIEVTDILSSEDAEVIWAHCNGSTL